MNSRQRIEEKARQLESEFSTFRSNPRAGDIMLRMFLLDGALEAPSPDLVSLIVMAVLRDDKLLQELGTLDEQAGALKIAELIAKTSDETMKNICLIEAKRQVTFSLLYRSDSSGSQMAIWYPLVDVMREPPLSIHRIVALRALDMLVARSIWYSDFKGLEALAQSVKEQALGGYHSSPERMGAQRTRTTL